MQRTGATVLTAVHIRIPDLTLYGPLLLWLLGGCAPGLASRIHELWAAQRRVDYHRVYGAVLGVVVALGVTCLGSRFITLPSLPSAALALAAAVPLAWVSFEANLALTRYFRRSMAQRGRARVSPRTTEGFAANVRPFRPNAKRVVPNRTPSVGGESGSGRGHATSAAPAPTTGILVAVAVLEELVFRALLMESALSVLPAARWTAIGLVALGVGLFCLGHVHYGAVEALGKLPLALLVTVPTLLTGSCLTACLVHVGFNLKVARANRALLAQAPAMPLNAGLP